MDSAQAQQSTSSNQDGTTTKSGLSILDRGIPVVVHDADDTASFRQGVSAPIERLHRLHGTSLLFEATKLLSLEASTLATSCTIFHRFFHQSSLTEYDVWSVAMASTLLASKVEEQPLTLKTIIHVYCHLYRKRLLVLLPDQDHQKNYVTEKEGESNATGTASSGNHELMDAIVQHPSVACATDLVKKWSLREKEQKLESLPLPMKLGPVYKEWHEQITNMEAIVLKTLGFTLYWMPDNHPHKFILYFCQVLELNESKVTQRAWNYCNDSCRLDLCLRFLPELIAASSILLATRDFSIELPTEPYLWWEIFLGKGKTTQLITAANIILGLVTELRHDSRVEGLVTSKAFVKSIRNNNSNNNNQPNPSFNDPESFLWDHQMEVLLQNGN